MSETVTEYQINGKTYIQYHGNAFDRGSADSWYHRPRAPHIYPKGSYNGDPVLEADMSTAEIEAYHAGYDHNEKFGGKKDWD